MPAIALLNEDRKLLGFIVTATDDVFVSGNKSDCVLTGVPQEADLFDTPLCSVIQEHKNIEYSLVRLNDSNSLMVDLMDGWKLYFSTEHEDNGYWFAKYIDGTELTGYYEFANKGGG